MGRLHGILGGRREFLDGRFAKCRIEELFPHHCIVEEVRERCIGSGRRHRRRQDQFEALERGVGPEPGGRPGVASRSQFGRGDGK